MNTTRPAPTRTDHSNPFARFSMHTRVPRIIREVQTLNPDYPAPIMAALDHLHDAIQNDAPIPMLQLPAPDYDAWASACAAHAGESWLGSDWFFAEVFFYRHLIEAVRWWETGRDPFHPKKAEELASAALWERLELALTMRTLPAQERLVAAIRNALWGNRIDLSYALSASHGSAGSSDDLLVDDSERVAARLLAAPGEVHLVADNAGSELAADLVLVDTLLDLPIDRVTLHLKMHPTFVSDATVQDVNGFMGPLASGDHGAAANALAVRLGAAFTAGRLRFAPDFYWNSARFAWDLPPRLADCFQGAALVIVKGDANYRRLVGDALWPPETPFSAVMSYFPAPVLALRTLKSDPVVGLPAGRTEQLDAIDKDWRINGRRGLIQATL